MFERLVKVSQEISRQFSVFYLFDLDSIEQRIISFKNTWESVFPRFKYCYSYKTNPLPAITQLIYKCGGGAEVVSGAELKWALADGFSGEQIYFDGPLKTEEELRLACRENVRIQMDSKEELKILSRIKHKDAVKYSIRLAVPYKEKGLSRFGFDLKEIDPFLTAARESNIAIEGLHFHVGSNINDPEQYVRALRMYKDVIRRLYCENMLKWLDIGGGYPCNSKKDPNPVVDIAVFVDCIAKFLKTECQLDLNTFELITEPGRHLVEDFGFLYCQVAATKERNGRRVAILNVGTNLVRSIQNWVHPIMQVKNEPDHSHSIDYDLYGANCFEMDLFKLDYPCKSPLEVGDGFLIGSCGGYDIPSTHPWIRPLPPIFGIYQGELVTIRKAQSAEELRHSYGLPLEGVKLPQTEQFGLCLRS